MAVQLKLGTGKSKIELLNDACDHPNAEDKHPLIRNRGAVLSDVSAGGRITMEYVIL